MIRTRRLSAFCGIHEDPLPPDAILLGDYDAQFCQWTGITLHYEFGGDGRPTHIDYHCGRCGFVARVGQVNGRNPTRPHPTRCRGPA